MQITNYIIVVIGLIVTLICALSFISPGLVKIISPPGNEKIKSIIAIIAGIIILISGLIVEIPAG